MLDERRAGGVVGGGGADGDGDVADVEPVQDEDVSMPMSRPMSPAMSSTGSWAGQGASWVIAAEFSSRSVPTWEGSTAGSAQIRSMRPAHADKSASASRPEELRSTPSGPLASPTAVPTRGRGCRP